MNRQILSKFGNSVRQKCIQSINCVVSFTSSNLPKGEKSKCMQFFKTGINCWTLLGRFYNP